MNSELDIQMKINIIELAITHCEIVLKQDGNKKLQEKYKRILAREKKNLLELQDKHPEYFI
jgi:hypothetical protein